MQIIKITTQTNPHIAIESNQEVMIIDTGHHADITVTIGEGAIVHYITTFAGVGNFKKIAHVASRASITWRSAVMGGNTQHEIITYHDGDGAVSDHKGVFLGHKKDRFVLNYWSDHTAKHTSGHIEIHGVLLDTSYADFKGNIKIAQSAQDTNGSLTEHTLLLGDRSRSDSVPQLEIDTNDVQAAHSSAITRIDDEQLFYLQSRGISIEEGKKLIVQGFLGDIIDSFGNEEVEKELHALIIEYLDNIN